MSSRSLIKDKDIKKTSSQQNINDSPKSSRRGSARQTVKKIGSKFSVQIKESSRHPRNSMRSSGGSVKRVSVLRKEVNPDGTIKN